MSKPSGHASPTTVVAVVLSFTFTALTCVLLRLWTRLGIVHQAGWDDFVVTLAMAFTTVFTICILNQVHFGLGRHQSSLTEVQERRLLIWFWISVWNYYFGLGLAKLSIVIQCLRIFGHIPKFRKISIVLFGVMFVFMWWTVLATMFMCTPVSHFWEPEKKGGKCLPRLPLWFFNSSFNIATDIATALLPLPVTKSLNLPKRQRYILMSVFGLGGIICLISIIRFHSLYAIAISDDPSWDNPLAALWAVLEATVGIIASCLPTLKGLVTRYFPNLFSSTIAGSRGGGGGGGGGDVELSRASKSDGGGGGTGERVIRIEKWDPKLSETSRSWGKSHKGVRVSEFETDVYTSNPPPLTTITASTRDGVVVGGGRTTSDGIQVTKVVEQVERRKEDWSLEDQESLVPVTARERF